MKHKGLTEDIWASFSLEARMFWGLFVTLLTFILNNFIGVSENAFINIFVSLLITIYVTIVLNAERDFEGFSSSSKGIILKISWMVPTISICSLISIVGVFYIYTVVLAIFPIFAEPLKGVYPQAMINICFGLGIFWIIKKQFIDTKTVQTIYKSLQGGLIPIFTSDGRSSLAFFIFFELAVIFISTALTYFTFEIFDLMLSANL